jgi:Tfp pilus assembly protein PilX
MNKQQQGYFLVAVVIITLFLTTIGLAIAALTSAQYAHTKRQVSTENAQLVTEAAVEQSVQQLNADDTFGGYTTAQQFFSNTSQGKGTFTSTITTNADGKSKKIVAIGKVYRKSTDTTPYITRKIEAIVVGTSSSGYSVQSGPGGLILGGSATITNSQVYVGGTITMTGASKIGTYNNPVNVDVANNACPTGNSPGPTYPQVCTGTQPISLAHSTNIYGTVCATGQTSVGPNNNIQGGNGGAGLKSGCTAPVYPVDVYDRQTQVNAVTTTAAGTSNTYVCNSSPFIRTWPGKLKLTGNVSIGSSCDVTISGDAYITGNLTINGASKIRVSNSLGATRPVVLVDGTITVNGSASMIANSSGTGIKFISTKSSAPCASACTTVTGTDLKTSQGVQVISVGGAVNLPGMVFVAQWGKVTLGGSGNVGAAAGQTVDLSGAGTIVFGTTLSSGSKTWSITSYQPLF